MRRQKPLEMSGVRVQLARIVPMLRSLLVILEALAEDLSADVGASVHDASAPQKEQKIVRVVPRHPTAVNHVEVASKVPARATASSKASCAHAVGTVDVPDGHGLVECVQCGAVWDPKNVAYVPRPEGDRVVARHKPNGAGLPGGERTVLVAVAQHGSAGVSNQQLSVLTGYKKSYRDLCLRHLRARGFVEAVDGQHVATSDGRSHLGSSFEKLPTGKPLRDHWLARLPEGERKILAIALGRYPEPVSRADLSMHTGYKKSYRDLCIRKIVARRLVEKVGAGVRASKTLFD